MSADLKQKVKRFIHSHNLLRGGEHVLVAVSGGADSVALLNVLRELKRRLRLRLTVAHLNHKIRGQAADQDAQFVRQLARRLHLCFALGTAAVPRLARRRGVSLEMAGRRARYDFFEKMALKHGCDVVATAHTADDNAETILLMLARGCGLPGLAGIAPLARIGKTTVIRPLLGIERRAIENYLRARELTWREDASNADPDFLRNRVRHELLPFLEARFNKGIKRALVRLADILRNENELLDALAAVIYAEARLESGRALDCALVAKYQRAARRRALRHWLLTNGIPARALDFQTINRLDNLLVRPGARALELAGGMIVDRHGQCLKIERRAASAAPGYRVRIAVPGRTILPGTGLSVTANIGVGVWRERTAIGEFPARASLALEAWQHRALRVRTWRFGDRMRPYGLDGSKKIQDIFSDAKVPAALRQQWPIFECGGDIIWIPGYRIAAGWQVADPGAKTLHLTINRSGAKAGC